MRYGSCWVMNASERFGDVKTGGSLGCSDGSLVEFTVLREEGRAKSKVRTLNFRKAKFQLFKEPVGCLGKLPSGTRKQNRAGGSLRTLSMVFEHKSSQSQGVRNEARKARDQHG